MPCTSPENSEYLFLEHMPPSTWKCKQAPLLGSLNTRGNVYLQPASNVCKPWELRKHWIFEHFICQQPVKVWSAAVFVHKCWFEAWTLSDNSIIIQQKQWNLIHTMLLSTFFGIIQSPLPPPPTTFHNCNVFHMLDTISRLYILFSGSREHSINKTSLYSAFSFIRFHGA